MPVSRPHFKFILISIKSRSSNVLPIYKTTPKKISQKKINKYGKNKEMKKNLIACPRKPVKKKYEYTTGI